MGIYSRSIIYRNGGGGFSGAGSLFVLFFILIACGFAALVLKNTETSVTSHSAVVQGKEANSYGFFVVVQPENGDEPVKASVDADIYNSVSIGDVVQLHSATTVPWIFKNFSSVTYTVSVPTQ